MSKWWLGGLLLGAVIVVLGLAVGLDRARSGVRIHGGLEGLRGGAVAPEPLRASDGVGDDAGDGVGREAAQPTPATRRHELEVRVLRDDGEPLVQAEVLVQRGGELLRAGRIGDDGSVTLVAFAGAGSVRVRLVGEEIARRELAQGHGRVEIVVPSGASVSGVVRIDGVPQGSVSLVLSDGPEERWSERVLRQAFERVGLREYKEQRWTRSAEDGTFRFACLPADWSGTLHLAGHERFYRNASLRLALARPQQGLVLDLESTPVEIRGRVVAGGRPVPRARWQASVHGGRKVLENDGLGACDELGRFSIRARSPLRWLRLEFQQPGVGKLVLERTEDELPGPEIELGSLELGDVELQPTRAVPFRVTTDSGAPLAGARALAREESLVGALDFEVWTGAPRSRERSFFESAPTDAEGLGVLPWMTLDQHEFAVRAKGFTTARVSFSDGDPLPLEVTLTPCAALEVRLLDANGDVPPYLALSVQSSEELFVASNRAPLPPYSRGGDGDHTWSWGDEDGVVRIEGLRAGIPLDLVPIDAYQTELEGPRGLTLAPGERRSLELRVEAPPRTLVVSVRDSLGFPIWGAQVAISASGSRTSHTQGADRTGMLRIPGFYGPRVDLGVESEFFRPRALEGVLVPPEGATVEVVLARDWWPW